MFCTYNIAMIKMFPSLLSGMNCRYITNDEVQVSPFAFIEQVLTTELSESAGTPLASQAHETGEISYFSSRGTSRHNYKSRHQHSAQTARTTHVSPVSSTSKIGFQPK